MKNIVIILCIASLWGCQTQEAAYRMSIKDSLYRDDSLLAINVLQQLNAREKGDSAVLDSGNSVDVQGPIKLFTLTKELRYGQEVAAEDSSTSAQNDSLPPQKDAKAVKTEPSTKPKSKTPSTIISNKSQASTPTAPPTAKTPTVTSPAPAPSKPVEAAKPAEPAKTPSSPTPPPPAKQ